MIDRGRLGDGDGLALPPESRNVVTPLRAYPETVCCLATARVATTCQHISHLRNVVATLAVARFPDKLLVWICCNRYLFISWLR